MKVYELLDSEDKWCRRTFARDAGGNPVDAQSPEAVQWCLFGAIDRCYSADSEREEALTRLTEHIDPWYEGSVTKYNDQPERTFDQVYEILTAADV